MQHPAVSSPRAAFPFFALPAELRNAVYALALTAPIPIPATFHALPPPAARVAGGLLATCKQIHSEAHALLYTLNTFRAGDEPHLATHGSIWLSRIGARNAALVRRVTVEMRALRTKADVLPFLIFLSELRISCSGSLQELAVWIAHSRHASPNCERLLAVELSKFTGLRRLTIGGGSPGWTDHWLPDSGLPLEIVPVGSPAWVEGQAERAAYRHRLRKGVLGDRVEDSRARREAEEARARGLDPRCGYTSRWLDDCPCSDCFWRRRQEMALEQFGCGCDDCQWVSAYGSLSQKVLDRFDIHLLASQGRLQSGVSSRPYAVDADTRISAVQPPKAPPPQSEPKVESAWWMAPGNVVDDVQNQGPNTPTFSMAKSQDQAPRTTRDVDKAAMKASLRREHRKWYGTSPLNSATSG